MLKAQYYGGVGSISGGRINVFGGIHAPMTGETTFWGSVLYTDGYGNNWYTHDEVNPNSITRDKSLCLGFDLSKLTEMNEAFSIGATFGIFGAKSKMHASFDGATLGRLYNTDVDIEYNQIDVHIGIAGLIYVVPEKVSIDFSLSPGFLFSFGDQVRYNRAPAIPTDVNNNTWHEAEKISDMGMPNIDIMALGRIGVSYHFTEIMWVGALFQYHQPIIAFGLDDSIDDVTRTVNEDLRYADRKHKDWAIMLTWGIDLE